MLLVGLLLVLVAPLVIWGWLTSSAGESFVRQEVERVAGEQLAGRLEIGELELSGLLHLELTDVRLWAPGESQPVISVARLTADVAVSSLLSRRIEVPRLEIEAPTLRLVQDEAGSNLARALASKQPSPDTKQAPQAQAPEPPWSLRLPHIDLSRGAVSIRGGERPLAAGDVGLEGSVSGTTEALGIDAGLSAQLLEPAAREVKLEVEGELSSDAVSFSSLVVAMGESHLDAAGHLRFDLASASVDLSGLTLSPAEAELLTPDLELLGAVSVSGTASLQDLQARTKLDLKLPEGTAALDASAGLDLDGGEIVTTWQGKLDFDDVRLHALLPGIPEMNLGGTLEVTDGRGLPGRGTARVSLKGRRLRYEKLPVQRLTLEGDLKATTLSARTLSAQAAGLQLQAKGTASPERAGLVGTLELPSLAATRTALQRGLGLTLPAMEGNARLDLIFTGPWGNPSLSATGEVPAFTMEGVSIEEARLRADIDRLSPLRLSTEASVEALTVGGIVGRALTLDASLDGRQVKADVDGELANTRVKAKVLALRAQAPEGVQRWRVDELQASALGVAMHAAGTTFVELQGERLRLEPLTLTGDLGTLTLSGRGGATGPLAASLQVESLRLERVPALLLPPDLDLEGEVAAKVDVTGTAARPQGEAWVSVTDGRLQTLAAVDATLTARLKDDRVSGTLTASQGATTRVTASVDVPLLAPARSARQPAPIDARLQLVGVTPTLIRSFAPALPELSGTLDGTVKLAGTWAAPQLDAQLSLAGGGGYGIDGVKATLQTQWKDEILKLSGRVTRGTALEADLDASAPLASAPLLDGEVPDWRTTVATGELRLTRLSLPWLEEARLLPEGTRGTLAGRVLASGTATDPELAATVAVRDLTFGPYRDLEATADLRVKDAVDLILGAQLADAPLLQMTARADVSASELVATQQQALWSVPLRVEAKLLPTPLSSLLAARDPLAADGPASATLTLTGTAQNPRLTLEVLLDTLTTSDGTPLGRLVVNGGYDGAGSRVTARFDSKKAGTLVALATLPGKLSAESFATPEAVEAVLARRAEISVTTENFDLALANGLTPSVRDIAGRMNLRFRKAGPLLEPGGEGSLEVRAAKASLVEYGELYATDADLVFAWPSMELRRLSGRSGTGRFSMRGDLGSTDGGESFKGSVHAELEALPLVQHFETKGWLSLIVDTRLEVRDRVITVSPLVLSKGLLKVADSNVTRQLTGKGKDVQSLDRHPDIVFASELQARRRKKAKDEQRAARADAPPPWRTEVRLSVPNDFVIDAPLGNKLTLGANLKITHDPARVARNLDPLDVEGRVNIVQGTVDVLRRFDVTKGQITLRSGQWQDPELNIEARHEGNDGSVVTVALGGTTSRMTKRFQLDPAGNQPPTSDEAEVLFYLTTGRRQTTANTTTPDLNEALATAGLNALGSLGVSGVKWLAQNVLPLPESWMPDVLAVDSDLRNGFGGGIDRVRAGKYFSDRIYIGLQYNREADVLAGESLFEAEGVYQLSDEASLKLRGAQGRFGAEATFQKDIPTSQQRKATERQ